MISVIIPIYNVEPYLRKCLDSVVNQTYKDLEILIIDDGSTDGPGAICDEYVKADKRIRVFHTANRGLSCARNLGLNKAMKAFVRQNIPLVGYEKWGLMMRAGAFLTRFQNPLIFRMAWSINRSIKTVSGFVMTGNTLIVRMRKNETGTACM